MKILLCPTGKRAFLDAASAWERLCEIRRQRRAENRTAKVRRRCPRRIYLCHECGLWHLTSAKASKWWSQTKIPNPNKETTT